MRVRRPQIDVEAGRRVEAFVPQEHAPGADAEADFGEVWGTLNGVKTKCHMFVLRLSHSGKAIHRIYPTQAQEAFLEGHIEAFNETSEVVVFLTPTLRRRRGLTEKAAGAAVDQACRRLAPRPGGAR